MRSVCLILLCAFLAFSLYFLGCQGKWLERIDNLIGNDRTEQLWWDNPTLLELLSSQGEIIGYLESCSRPSWICIYYLNRRQWSLCCTVPYNKDEHNGVVQPNYSLLGFGRVYSSGKSPKHNQQEKKTTMNVNYGTLALHFCYVSREMGPLSQLVIASTRPQFYHRKPKKSRRRCLYYPNSCASRQLLLQGGDISVNPGPAVNKPSAPRCSNCEKPVAKNHKRCICSVCFDVMHAKCSKVFDPKRVQSSVPMDWVCQRCTITLLPFMATTCHLLIQAARQNR